MGLRHAGTCRLGCPQVCLSVRPIRCGMEAGMKNGGGLQTGGLDAKDWLSCALRNLQLRISFKPDLSGEGKIWLSKEKYRAYFI